MPAPEARASVTDWSLVLAASRDEGDGANLDRLCRKYLQPAYVFARRSGFSPADAEDATQEFFQYFLSRGWLQQADAQRGRFRDFFYTLLRNFLSNFRRKRDALKRGGVLPPLPIDLERCESELQAASSADTDPVRAYERSWANCVLDAAMTRLSEEQAAAGRQDDFAALRPLIGRSRAPGDYERASARTGWARGRIAVQVHRLSRRFAELIRIEVSNTLASGDELEDELRHLLASLGT